MRRSALTHPAAAAAAGPALRRENPYYWATDVWQACSATPAITGH